MKPGDMIRIVRSNTSSFTADAILNEGPEFGLLVDTSVREYLNLGTRRIATILHSTGEIQSWPLDSHYKIEVINESR